MDNLIFISDLDGTLLDHDTYSYKKAQPALDLLASLGIPLILNSSKTAAEISGLRQRLGLSTPFVIENGAGICLPEIEADDSYELIALGQTRSSILSLLNRLRDEHELPFTGFADMSLNELVAETGLSEVQAELANQRAFTEPIKWEGNDQQWSIFCTELGRNELRATRGGRFISISSRVDKGQATQHLRSHYEQKWGKNPVIVALGDSENDIPMLEVVDYPVLIRSPAHELPKLELSNLMIPELLGPEAWNDAVIFLLRKFNLVDEKHHG